MDEDGAHSRAFLASGRSSAGLFGCELCFPRSAETRSGINSNEKAGRFITT